MSKQTYDIVTVGGGIAASALAGAMAKRGAKVLVLEKEQRFKDRVRGEGIIPWGVAEAQELGILELLRATCGHDVSLVEGHGASGSRLDYVATFTCSFIRTPGNAREIACCC